MRKILLVLTCATALHHRAQIRIWKFQKQQHKNGFKKIKKPTLIPAAHGTQASRRIRRSGSAHPPSARTRSTPLRSQHRSLLSKSAHWLDKRLFFQFILILLVNSVLITQDMSAASQSSWAARIGHSIKDVRARAVESFLQKYQNNFLSIDSISGDGELVLALIEWFNTGDARQAEMLSVIDDLAHNSSGVLCLCASGALAYFTQYRAYAPPNLLHTVDSIIARVKSSPSQPAPPPPPMRAGDQMNSDINADLSAATKQVIFSSQMHVRTCILRLCSNRPGSWFEKWRQVRAFDFQLSA